MILMITKWKKGNGTIVRIRKTRIGIIKQESGKVYEWDDLEYKNYIR